MMTQREQIAAIDNLDRNELVQRLKIAETVLSSLAASSANTCRKANEATPWPAIGPYPEEKCLPQWWRATWEQEAAAWIAKQTTDEGGA